MRGGGRMNRCEAGVSMEFEGLCLWSGEERELLWVEFCTKKYQGRK
jgi:hypothetical protein